MYTNTSEIPTKKITAKVNAVRDKILPVKAEKPPKALKPSEKPPKALKPPDKLVKTPAKPKMPSKTTMTTSMSDHEGMGKAHHAVMGKAHLAEMSKAHPEGETKPKNKRHKTKTTPAEIVAQHKAEHELDKTKYKTEMQSYLKERLKQGANKIILENPIKQ